MQTQLQTLQNRLIGQGTRWTFLFPQRGGGVLEECLEEFWEGLGGIPGRVAFLFQELKYERPDWLK